MEQLDGHRKELIQIFLGIDIRFSMNNIGEQLAITDSNQVGNHKSCVSEGILKKFENSTFTEYLIEVDRNNYIYSEDKQEKLFSFGEIMQTIKKELVYVEI